MTLSDQLRDAIADCGMSVNAIAKESSIPQPMLARFVSGQDIRLATADRLADYFGLELAIKSKMKKRRRSKRDSGR